MAYDKQKKLTENTLALLLLAYLIAFPFGQLGRVEIGIVTIHIIDILIDLFVLSSAVYYRGFASFPFLQPLGIFAAVAFFSFFIGLDRFGLLASIAPFLYLVRLVVYLFFFFLLWSFLEAKKWREVVYNSLIVVGASVVFLGMLQYIFLPDLRFLATAGWDPHYFRLAGSFLDPGFTGILIVFFIILVFAKKWGREGKLLKPLLLALSFIALLLTYSRASYLAFLAGFFGFYIVRRKLRYLLLPGLLLALGVFFLPRPQVESGNLARTSTVITRMSNYQQTVILVTESPLFGVGFNFYRNAAIEKGFIDKNARHLGSGSDSSLLFVAATMGLVGVLALVNLGWHIFVKLWQARKVPEGITAFSSTFALLAHSVFNNSLFYPWVMGWMIIIFSLFLRASKAGK